MRGYDFKQLVDLEQIQSLLRAHRKITGVCSAILDLEQNILIAEGWEEICTRFHRVHPVTSARCLESNKRITHRMHEAEKGYRECKCENGLWDIAMPIVIDGTMVASFWVGPFFYDDDEVDEAFFRTQAKAFGFDEKAYIAALRKVPIFSREQICDILAFYGDLVQVLAESGWKKMELEREVGERQKAEEAHLASRDFLEKIINSMPDPIFVKDRQHRFVLVNEAECALAGRRRAEMLGRSDYDFFPREQGDVFWEKDEIVLETGEKNINEEEITDARGEKRIIVTKKNLCQDLNGNKYIVGIIRDISERKAAEEQLALLTFALNRVHEAAYLIDRHARLLYVNDEACRGLGFSREELLDLTVHDIDPDYSVEQRLSLWSQLRERGTLTFEVSHRKKNGQRFPAEVTASYFEYAGTEYVLALARNITERKRADRQLREALDFSKGVINAIPDLLFEVDREGRYLNIWTQNPELLAAPKEILLTKTIHDALSRESAAIVTDGIREAEEEGLSFGKVICIELPSGPRWFELSVSRKSIVSDAGVTFIILSRDITDRKLAEQRLRQSLDFSEGVVNAIPDVLFEVSREGRYLNVWTKKPELLAAQKEVLLGKTVHDVLSRESAARALDGIREAEEEGISFGKTLAIDLPQGRHWFEQSISRKPGSNPADVRFLVLSRDVTERVLMEAELKESEDRYRRSSHLLASILESASSVSVYALDREYRYLSFNRRHREKAKLKWGADIAVGMNMLDAINTEEHRDFCRRGFDRVLSGSSYSIVSREVVVRGGQEVFEYNDNHGSPIFNDDGAVIGLTVFAIDITERKRMEEELREREQRYRDVFENVSDALYLLEVTEDGRFRNIEVNPALVRSTGLSRAEMIGKYVDETVSDETGRTVVAKYRRCVEAGGVIDEEVTLDLPAGRRHYHSTLIPVRNDSGRIHRIAGITRDITDRKRAEELLGKQIELETRLAKLAEVSPGAMCSFHMRLDGTACLPYVSPRYEELTGLSSDELNADANIILSRVHADDREAHLASIAESARTLRNWQDEFRIQHPTRGWIWLEGHSAPERQADGSTIWYGFLHDISDRKRRQAREQIRLSIFEGLAQGRDLAEILKLVVKYVELVNPDFIGNIMLADVEGKYLHPVCSLGLPEDYLAAVNKVRVGDGIGSCGTAVWRGETVIAADLRTHPFWAKYKQPALLAGLLSCWSEPIFGASGKVLGTISVYRRRPGGPRGMELDLVRHACHLAAVAIERKRALEQLHKREQEFRTLIENSPNIILRYDRNCRRSYVNPAFERETGIPAGKALLVSPNTQWQANIPPEEYTAKLRKVMATGHPAEILLEWPRLDDGQMVSHAFHVVAERDLDGKVAGALAIGHNITALKEAELRLAKLAATLPGFLFILRRDPNGSACLPYASPRIQEIFGVSPESVAKDASELFARVHPGDLGRLQNSIAASAHDFTPWRGEFRVRHPEKGELWAEGRSIPKSQPDGGILWYGFLHDITEHKKLEQELFKAKKMEIIGQLAGGVAHEVRNPLNAILSITEALFREKEIAGNPEFDPYIMHIRAQVGRLSKLMTDLLDLGKPIRPADMTVVFFKDICSEMRSLWAANDLSRNHPLEGVCDPVFHGLQVHADEARLLQVLLNLIENAAQHSPAGKAILVCARAIAGGRIMMEVKDAGKGIPPEKIDRIFEPFFTTRRGGTGLGLSLVKHFVESMGGEVCMLNNEPPPGCTVKLVLRMAEMEGAKNS